MPFMFDTDPVSLPTAPYSVPTGTITDAERDRLAHSVARQAVVADIQSECCRMTVDGATWWDTRPMVDRNEHDSTVVDMATEALRYALATGLVSVHPQRPYLLQINQAANA